MQDLALFLGTYIVQQNGLCGTYAFKTTYDVTFSLAELYGVK